MRSYIAQTSARERGIDAATTIVAKDGVGWGFGLGIIVALGLIAYFLWQLGKNMNPSSIAQSVGEYVSKTDKSLSEIKETTSTLARTTNTSLNDIAEVTAGTDRKVDGLGNIIEEVRDLQSKTVEMGTFMSTKMGEVQDEAKVRGKEMSDRLSNIESHLQSIREERNGTATRN